MSSKYKNILWIDDMDTQEASDTDTRVNNMKNRKERRKNKSIDISNTKNYKENIKECFGEDWQNDINVIDNIDKAVKIIIGDKSQNSDYNIYDFDLIIFDINMESDKSVGIDNYTDLSNIFKENGVILPTEYDEFLKMCGVYLYILLINIGYPKNRIICYTANTTGNSKEKFKKLALNATVITKKEKCGNNWLEEWYENNSYYRIRRLIYQACNYWQNYITENSDIVFNKIYNLDTDKNVFYDMLERTKMFFPVTKPKNPEELYYQAMHSVSMLHEEKAKIENISEPIKKYHQIIRNFRNWSSHNKFENHSMNEQQFAFLFCISLRTYFDADNNNGSFKFTDNTFTYEKIFYNGFNNIEYNQDLANDKIEKYFDMILTKVEVYGGRNSRFMDKINLETALLRLGEQPYPMPFKYLQLSLFDTPFELTFIKKGRFIDEQIISTINSSINNQNFTPEVKVRFEYKKSSETSTNNKAQSKIDNLWRSIAFNLL